MTTTRGKNFRAAKCLRVYSSHNPRRFNDATENKAKANTVIKPDVWVGCVDESKLNLNHDASFTLRTFRDDDVIWWCEGGEKSSATFVAGDLKSHQLGLWWWLRIIRDITHARAHPKGRNVAITNYEIIESSFAEQDWWRNYLVRTYQIRHGAERDALPAASQYFNEAKQTRKEEEEEEKSQVINCTRHQDHNRAEERGKLKILWDVLAVPTKPEKCFASQIGLINGIYFRAACLWVSFLRLLSIFFLCSRRRKKLSASLTLIMLLGCR